MRRLLVAWVVAVVAGVVVSLAAGGSGSAVAGRWVIRDLGTLGGPESVASDINERGQIVGLSVTAAKDDDGRRSSDVFLWANGRMRGLGADAWRPPAINAHGQVVGSGRHAFLWQNGRLRDLGTLGGEHSWAVALNERGQVVGGSDTTLKYELSGSAIEHAFLWEDGHIQDLTPSVSGWSWPVALNNRGQVLLQTQGKNGLWENGRFRPLDGIDLNDRGQVLIMAPVAPKEFQLALWEDGHVRLLRKPASGWPGWSPECSGNDINEQGAVAGACEDRRERWTMPLIPVMWKKSTPIKIAIAFGDRGQAVALNDAGQVVGYTSRVRVGTLQTMRHAFVWEKGRTTDLGTLGGEESEAIAINNHGQVLGWAKTKRGDKHAVLWKWQPAK